MNKEMKQLRWLPIFALLLFTLACSSLTTKRTPATSAPFASVETGSLFASYDVLNVELDAPLAPLFAKKDPNPQAPRNKEAFVDGVLSYENELLQKIQIPVEIHLKGFSTLNSCSFPKLELKIKSKDSEGTLFESTKSVDLNTHCFEKDDPAAYDVFKSAFWNHREALIYRMADVLEIPTLKARPVFIRYKNTQIPNVDQNPAPYRAFFVEDMGNFRKRLNAKEIKGIDDPLKSEELAKDPSKASRYVFTDVKSSPQIDPEDASRIALFQAMIGNEDWFIKMHPTHKRFENLDIKTNLWNTKIAELPDGKWVLFPQDFSISGILSGEPKNRLDKVTFGFSGEATQQSLKQNFLNKKTDIYLLTETLVNDPEGGALMKKTLDGFYQKLK